MYGKRTSLHDKDEDIFLHCGLLAVGGCLILYVPLRQIEGDYFVSLVSVPECLPEGLAPDMKVS